MSIEGKMPSEVDKTLERLEKDRFNPELQPNRPDYLRLLKKQKLFSMRETLEWLRRKYEELNEGHEKDRAGKDLLELQIQIRELEKELEG